MMPPFVQPTHPTSENHLVATAEVDASGLACPLPILKAKRALNQLASGQLLKVITTDPGAEQDFQDFARQTGHTLIAQIADQALEGHWIHWLRRR